MNRRTFTKLLPAIPAGAFAASKISAKSTGDYIYSAVDTMKFKGAFTITTDSLSPDFYVLHENGESTGYNFCDLDKPIPVSKGDRIASFTWPNEKNITLSIGTD